MKTELTLILFAAIFGVLASCSTPQVGNNVIATNHTEPTEFPKLTEEIKPAIIEYPSRDAKGRFRLIICPACGERPVRTIHVCPNNHHLEIK